MNKQLLIIIVCSFLLGCAETHSPVTTNETEINTQKASTINVKYTCSRGNQLSVHFTATKGKENKNIAIINGFSEQAIILPNKAVASGFLYSNGKYSLRGKSEQATWTVGRMAPFQCSIDDKVIFQKDLK